MQFFKRKEIKVVQFITVIIASTLFKHTVCSNQWNFYTYSMSKPFISLIQFLKFSHCSWCVDYFLDKFIFSILLKVSPVDLHSQLQWMPYHSVKRRVHWRSCLETASAGRRAVDARGVAPPKVWFFSGRLLALLHSLVAVCIGRCRMGRLAWWPPWCPWLQQ